MQTRDKIDLCHYKDGIIVSKIVRIISLMSSVRTIHSNVGLSIQKYKKSMAG
ncbi:hypothetical protein N7917_29970 [Bacillus sp. OR9]|nr:hypothetical protein [Bacillus sp. OR9]